MNLFKRLISVFVSISIFYSQVVSAQTINQKNTKNDKAFQKLSQSLEKYSLFLKEKPKVTFQQYLALIKNFSPDDFNEYAKKNLSKLNDQSFPQFSFEDQADHVILKVGTGHVQEQMMIYKNNPLNFASYKNKNIPWSSFTDGVQGFEEIQKFSRDKVSFEKNAIFEFLIKRLQSEASAASDFAVVGGLGLLAVGIAAGAYFLSRAKFQHKVSGTTVHQVQVPTDFTLNTNHTLQLPLTNTLTLPTQQKGQR